MVSESIFQHKGIHMQWALCAKNAKVQRILFKIAEEYIVE